jgi:hypothetical protein
LVIVQLALSSAVAQHGAKMMVMNRDVEGIINWKVLEEQSPLSL